MLKYSLWPIALHPEYTSLLKIPIPQPGGTITVKDYPKPLFIYSSFLIMMTETASLSASVLTMTSAGETSFMTVSGDYY
jgi:hypothetical protein